MDASGALYGNTGEGGGVDNNGVVFKLAPPVSGASPWTETVIWRLDKRADGEAPSTQMLFDNAGNLYGTWSSGGLHGHGFEFVQLVQQQELRQVIPDREVMGAWIAIDQE